MGGVRRRRFLEAVRSREVRHLGAVLVRLREIALGGHEATPSEQIRAASELCDRLGLGREFLQSSTMTATSLSVVAGDSGFDVEGIWRKAISMASEAHTLTAPAPAPPGIITMPAPEEPST